MAHGLVWLGYAHPSLRIHRMDRTHRSPNNTVTAQ